MFPKCRLSYFPKIISLVRVFLMSDISLKICSEYSEKRGLKLMLHHIVWNEFDTINESRRITHICNNHETD